MIAVFSTPSFIAMASAVLNPIPRMSRAKRYGLGHDLHGVGAVGSPEDPHRPRCADAIAVQKDHDLSHRLLLSPRGHNASRPHRANAIDLAQPAGCCLDHVEHLLAEGAQQILRVDRADAADHARGEILLDAFDRLGAAVLRNLALNCWPWVRSLIHSPAAIVAACPTR